MDPSKCEIDVDQATMNWQSIGENKPGLLECSKDVAKIVAENLFTQEDDHARKMSVQEEKLRQKDTDKSSKEDFEKDSAHISPEDFEEGSLDSYKHGKKKVISEF